MSLLRDVWGLIQEVTKAVGHLTAGGWPGWKTRPLTCLTPRLEGLKGQAGPSTCGLCMWLAFLIAWCQGSQTLMWQLRVPSTSVPMNKVDGVHGLL